MAIRNHTDRVCGVRLSGTDHYAYENSAGELDFGPICARTLFFDPTISEDEDSMLATMSGAPGGHKATEQVFFVRTLVSES